MVHFTPPMAPGLFSTPSPGHSWSGHHGNGGGFAAGVGESGVRDEHSFDHFAQASFSADSAVAYDGVIDPQLVNTGDAPDGFPMSDPPATQARPPYSSQSATVTCPPASVAINFSHRTFWTYSATLTNLNNEIMEGTYEQLYLQYPEVRPIISHDFGNWYLHQPYSELANMPSTVDAAGEDDEQNALPEPPLNGAIQLKGGILLTTFSVHTSRVNGTLSTSASSGASDEREPSQPKHDEAHAAHTAPTPGEALGHIEKMGAGNDAHSTATTPNSDSALESFGFPHASLCEKFTVDGQDDWKLEEGNVAELSQRFFNALTGEFDHNPTDPPLKSGEKEYYIGKQTKALANLQKNLATDLGRTAAKLNCEKLAKTIILVHKIGAPKQAYVKNHVKNKLLKAICSERSNAVEAAITAHKRIAIDVSEGQNLQKLACNPSHVKHDKIAMMKSNYMRDQNNKAYHADKKVKEAALAQANGLGTRDADQSATLTAADTGDGQKPSSRKRKIGRDADTDGESQDAEQLDVKKAKAGARKKTLGGGKKGMAGKKDQGDE
ncbi:hypothetical protein LTR85_004644 [Meristemomyces frigidus]|nr:hypothetical protein LTR85_004644 [Meristemomyces frigidus]